MILSLIHILEQQAQAIYTQYFIKNKAPNWKLGQLSDLVLVNTARIIKNSQMVFIPCMVREAL